MGIVERLEHTPGPWTFNDPWAGFSSITDASGNLIFGIARGDPDEAQPVPVCEANARLIALAPELYEYVASSASNGCATAQALLARVRP